MPKLEINDEAVVDRLSQAQELMERMRGTDEAKKLVQHVNDKARKTVQLIVDATSEEKVNAEMEALMDYLEARRLNNAETVLLAVTLATAMILPQVGEALAASGLENGLKTSIKHKAFEILLAQNIALGSAMLAVNAEAMEEARNAPRQ